MILIIDCGSNKSPKIGKFIDQLGEKTACVSLADDWKDIITYKGIIISGAPILVTEIDTKPYLDKFQFLTTITIPVLGICFGHQILGMVWGASAARCKEARKSIEISLERNSKLFKGIGGNSIFNEDHCEMISLPKHFEQTATSDHCKIEGMQHLSKALFGVQFHPETSGKNGLQLLRNFLRICNDQK